MGTTNGQIVFAKEAMTNLKIIGISLLFSLLLFLVLYAALDWHNYSAGGVVLGEDIKYIHERQKEAFWDDIIGKSKLLFVILSSILIVGRYILMGFNWANRTSKLNN